MRPLDDRPLPALRDSAVRSLLGALLHRSQRIGLRARGYWLSVVIRSLGGRCGRRLLVGRGLYLKSIPHAGIVLGDDVLIGPFSVLDVPEGATLVLEDRVRLTHSVVIAAAESVRIGSGTMVAEFVSIRDADHGTDASAPIATQPLVTRPVRIGEEAWIGRGAAILSGAIVGDGAVVGANAVVRGEIPDHAIAAGVPATVRRQRRTAS